MIGKIFFFITICIPAMWISPVLAQEDTDYAGPPENSMYIHEPVFGGNVYIYESGKDLDDTIMLVHGMGGDASDIWKNQIPLLEKRFHIVYFDLPGFGRSEAKNSLYSPRNYSLFIKWVYDKFINKPMYLAGHSLGGSISLYYTAAYPDTVRRLIIADAAGILHGTALVKSLAKSGLKNSGKRLFKNYPELFDNLIQSAIENSNQTFPKNISTVLENYLLRRIFFSNPKRVASAALINTDFSEKIAKIKGPLFIIWGENDPVAPLRTGKMLSMNINNSCLNIIPGSGHCPMTEKPSEFNDLFTKCLFNDLSKQENKLPIIRKKSIVLEGKENVTIEGEYDSIKIKDCNKILIKNVKTKSLDVKNSWIDIENTEVKSDSTGMSAYNSVITATGGSFNGHVGISVTNCKLDLAGVKIEGKKAAVETTSDIYSAVIFSVCKIKSPNNDRYIHDMIEIGKDNPL